MPDMNKSKRDVITDYTWNYPQGKIKKTLQQAILRILKSSKIK